MHLPTVPCQVSNYLCLRVKFDEGDWGHSFKPMQGKHRGGNREVCNTLYKLLSMYQVPFLYSHQSLYTRLRRTHHLILCAIVMAHLHVSMNYYANTMAKIYQYYISANWTIDVNGECVKQPRDKIVSSIVNCLVGLLYLHIPFAHILHL